MNEQRTPDHLDAENELICEKLLGWEPLGRTMGSYGVGMSWRRIKGGSVNHGTPSFTTWAEAGLILDALRTKGMGYSLLAYRKGAITFVVDGELEQYADTGPLAIRATALEYIKAVKL